MQFGGYVCVVLGPDSYTFDLHMVLSEFAFVPVFFLCFSLFFLAKFLNQMLLIVFFCVLTDG